MTAFDPDMTGLGKGGSMGLLGSLGVEVSSLHVTGAVTFVASAGFSVAVSRSCCVG